MDELKHYGMPRRSGRYPWGSGESPFQSAIDFKGTVDELKKKGLKEVEIAKGLGLTTSQLRSLNTLSREEIRAADRARVIELKGRGLSNVAIGERMGINESSVRSLLDPVKAERATITQSTSNMLKESIDKYKYIDVGFGVSNHVGVSGTKLNTSISQLVEEGYTLHFVKVEQRGIPGQYTTIKTLAAPGVTYSEVFKNRDNIQSVKGRTEDFGRTYNSVILKPVESLSSSRVQVRYKEDGGSDKDGVIELRRGVNDLDLGNANYAQVRIGVDGTHYMKGMAMYADKMPDGIDAIYNTSQKRGTPMMGKKGDTVMKNMEVNKELGKINLSDPQDAFGSSIDAQRGCLNILREEGEWDTWSKNISSQVLSKQSTTLAKEQLGLAYQIKKDEFNDNMALTNPTVKKLLLEKFADGVDADAVHLKAAALPRQATKVILPITQLSENEVYAPTFKPGESVVLIRHPHGGKFEIAQLTVNNNSRVAKSIMGNAQDSIGINPKVAQKLSGADFDGDTVIVIPNDAGLIKIQPSIKSLQNFDPKESYPGYEGMPKMKSATKQKKMGEVSNLITDMSIRGADNDEIARAVRHSMVVIDAEKHDLNYKQSYKDHGIASLAKKYQDGGASTIVSLASSELRIPHRVPGAAVGPISKKTGKPTKLYVDPNTGEKLYTETGETYIKRTISPSVKTQHGLPSNASYKQTVLELKKQGFSEADIARVTKETSHIRTTKTTKMAEAKWDPEKGALVVRGKPLPSETPMEGIYVNHARQMKELANQARKEAVSIKPSVYSASAKKTYEKEVKSLNDSLFNAQKNAPLERQAQVIATAIATKKIQANPGMDNDEIKKINTQALAEARARTGAKKDPIKISPREWEAIQAGAISDSKLKEILTNTDLDVIKKYATPRDKKTGMTSSQIIRAKKLLDSGNTQSDVAKALGVSISALIEEVYS